MDAGGSEQVSLHLPAGPATFMLPDMAQRLVLIGINGHAGRHDRNTHALIMLDRNPTDRSQCQQNH